MKHVFDWKRAFEALRAGLCVRRVGWTSKLRIRKIGDETILYLAGEQALGNAWNPRVEDLWAQDWELEL